MEKSFRFISGAFFYLGINSNFFTFEIKKLIKK